MMRKSLGLLVLCIGTITGFAQDGIVFEKAENWQQVINKAKATGKYIFVDCYTTWCKPCKEMSLKVYPNRYVGYFMNEKFINVEVQMDSSSKDNDHVRKWYSQAAMLKKRYKINGFPALLVFGPDGQILHKSLGAITDTLKFVEKVKQFLDPNNQYYTLQRKYNETKDVKLIAHLVNSAREADESPEAVSNDFVKSLKNPFTKANLEVMQQITNKTSEKGYALFLQNSKRINDTLGAGAAEGLVKRVLWNDIVVPFFKAYEDNHPWNELQRTLTKKSNIAYGKEITSKAKYNYYGANKRWREYEVSLLDYLNHYGGNIQPYLLNNMLWDIFLHATDSCILTAYLPWAKKSIEYDSTFTSGMDTYANFLYKLGRSEEAIKWETKALTVATQTNSLEDKKVFEETLDKMAKGIKTWE